MIVGDLVSGSAQLAEAGKKLLMHWELTTEQWHDKTSEKFEETYLEPLQPVVRMTLDAIGRLAETLERAQRECS